MAPVWPLYYTNIMTSIKLQVHIVISVVSIYKFLWTAGFDFSSR